MAVDVACETVVNRPCAEVAAYASDPSNAPLWYVKITQAEWRTQPPLRVGSQVAFVAHFLGRRLAYTYEITELQEGQRLVMRTAEGPFPMETTYTWEALSDKETRMTLRNRGKPVGFSRLMSPMMARSMKGAMTKDLARLKALLEA